MKMQMMDICVASANQTRTPELETPSCKPGLFNSLAVSADPYMEPDSEKHDSLADSADPYITWSWDSSYGRLPP